MNCKDAQDLFSFYVEGLQEARGRLALEAHLEECVQCRQELELFRKVLGLVASLPEMEVASGFSVKVRERVEALIKPRGFWRTLFSPLYIKLPLEAVALFLVVIGAILFYQSFPDLRKEAVVPVPPEFKAPEREALPTAPSSPAVVPKTKAPLAPREEERPPSLETKSLAKKEDSPMKAPPRTPDVMTRESPGLAKEKAVSIKPVPKELIFLFPEESTFKVPGQKIKGARVVESEGRWFIEIHLDQETSQGIGKTQEGKYRKAGLPHLPGEEGGRGTHLR